MNSTGKIKNVDDVSDVESRPDDITFVKSRCTLDGSLMDSRIKSEYQLSFQFSFRLPQHSYDVQAGTYTATSTPSPISGTPISRCLNFDSITQINPPSSPAKGFFTTCYE